MEGKRNNRGAESFAAAFASCFGDALTGTLGSQVSFSTLESPDVSAQSLEPVQFRIAVEGVARGDCFLEFSKSDVILLGSKLLGVDPAEYKDEYARALQQMIAKTLPGVQSKLAAVYGALTLNIEQVSGLVFGGMLVVSLVGRGLGQSQIPVLLYFDGRFHQALSEDGAVESFTESSGFRRDIRNLDLVMDVELNVSLRFGQRQMPLCEILELESGSVIELDRKVDDPIELLLDGKVIARGEAVIVDGNYGLRVTEVPHSIVSDLNPWR